jgi:septum formation protein
MKPTEEGHRIILASKSPRRRYLLERAGLVFRVIPSGVDERSLPARAPEEFVRALAEAKAEDIAGNYPESWVIGADTLVVVDGAVLGKPRSGDEARRMLGRLSGRTHQVLTGYCILQLSSGTRRAETVKTDVCFKALSPAEIDWYVGTGEPFDKAGAYAIQGIGTFLVRSINGSYTNVVGLPVCEVVEFLIERKVIGFEAGADAGAKSAAGRAHG